MKKKLSKKISLNFLNKNKLHKYKRSQSEVISTVLLILLVVVASTVLIAFVIPLVNKFLEGSKCNDYIEKIKINNNEKYTCYDKNAKRLLLQVKLDNTLEKSKADQIKGVRIIIETSGSDSKSYEIIPPNSNPSGQIVLGNGEASLIIPNGIRTEITYNISNILLRPNSTLIYPILNGSKSCASSAYTLNNIPYCK